MLIVLLLSIANGFFAMSETAVVSARKARLQIKAQTGDAGAKFALSLAEDPSDFLSTVQVGITLIGILAALFGGEAIVAQLQPQLESVPLLAPYSNVISTALVVLIITYIQLIIGELVPKQIGITFADRISALVARPLMLVSQIARPVVWLLSLSTRLVLRILRVPTDYRYTITAEEVQIMMEEGNERGVFDPEEGQMVEQILSLSDIRINEIMTPRPDVVALDINDSLAVLRSKVSSARYSRYPVIRGDEDNVIGVIFARDLLAQSINENELDLKNILHKPLIVPEGLPVLEVLRRFKVAKSQLAMVIDEYGELQGLVTFNDLVEVIVGEVPEAGDTPDPQAFQRDDGSWLIDGRFLIDDLKELLGIDSVPDEEENYFHTVGGFVMAYLRRVPHTGDKFDWGQFRFEVVDMDERRVDKVLLTLLPPQDEVAEAAA